MAVTQQQIDQAYVDLGPKFGGSKNDYFALLYLAQEFGLKPHDVAKEVAFGRNDNGVDAYHIDKAERNLYLYQFKWSKDHKLFVDSLERLITDGMARIFGDPLQDKTANDLLIQLRNDLYQKQAVIDRVFIHFVFNGDPEAAENSITLRNLREDLEGRKHLINSYFRRDDVTLTVAYLPNQTRKIVGHSHITKTHRYKIGFHSSAPICTSTGETLHVGPIKLIELLQIYEQMDNRLFERNIRFGLADDTPPNRSLRDALKRIVVKQVDPPEVFAFNHNGICLSVDSIEAEDDLVVITDPRVLNGAQTITAAAKFCKDNQVLLESSDVKARLAEICVIAKIVHSQSRDFVTTVTICNNKQNRVDPWNLRANDPIQWKLEDKFRDDLDPGVFYERQQNAFQRYLESDIEDMGLVQGRAVEIKRLAQTFLAVQGEIDKISSLPNVFDSDDLYKQTFRDSYLNSDIRKILLAYKIQFNLTRIVEEIQDKGSQKNHEYFRRARNLVWALLVQGVLNAPDLADLLENYGGTPTMEADYKEYLKALAGNRVRLILLDLAKIDNNKRDISEGKFNFLRSKSTYKTCMDSAWQRFSWKKMTF